MSVLPAEFRFPTPGDAAGQMSQELQFQPDLPPAGTSMEHLSQAVVLNTAEQRLLLFPRSLNADPSICV